MRALPWTRIAIYALTFLLFSSLFFLYSNIAWAQQAQNGPASLADQLGITSYRVYVFEALTAIGIGIAWIGGSLMDFSIAVFTAGMARVMEELGLTVAVGLMWGIIRDIFNLLFIFGLIYAGFRIIIDANDSSSKRTIGTIILAALLINFSLYVAQVIVDFTNVATYQVHQLIAGQDNSGKEYPDFGIKVPNTSDQFVFFSGVNNLDSENNEVVLAQEIGRETSTNQKSNVDGLGTVVVLGLIFCLFYMILGFIFGAIAFVLMTRFFALIFYMIFSPLMFLGWVLPNMSSHTSNWWKNFLNQAIVGPATLFMIYLSLRALEGIGTAGRDGGFIATAVYLMLVTAFLLASLKVAKHFGAIGSQQMISFAHNVGNTARGYAGRAAGGATLGTLARVGRATGGKWAQNYAESDKARDAAANSRWGRFKLNMASRIGDSSFDARNVGEVGKKMGIGSGRKGGYKTVTEEIAKKDKEYAKKLGEVSDDDETVSRLKSEVDFNEQLIKKQKSQYQALRKRGDAAPAEIEAAKARLEDMEDALSDNKEKLAREKQRRQLGVVGYTPESTTLDKSVVAKKNEVGDLIGRFVDPTTTSDELDELKIQIQQRRKELADLEKSREKTTGGYANTVANFGFMTNFLTGRNKAQNDNSAKEIRGEYVKKIKSKDKKGDDKGDAKEPKKEGTVAA